MWPFFAFIFTVLSEVMLCDVLLSGFSVNPSRPGKNDRHFADDIFKCIFMNEKFCILIKSSLKFVLKGPINNKSALAQVMAWSWRGDKPLSQQMLPQFIDGHMQHQGEIS